MSLVCCRVGCHLQVDVFVVLMAGIVVLLFVVFCVHVFVAALLLCWWSFLNVFMVISWS